MQLATWLISCVLWLQGRGRFVSPGCPSDSCHRGRSFWEPPSEGETCGETGAKVVRGHPAQAAWARAPKGGFEKGHATRHPPSPVHIRPPTQDTTAPHHTHTLALPSSPPWLPVAADARLSRGAPRPARAHKPQLPPLPQRPGLAPEEVALHPALPPPLRFGFFFLFSFMTQLVRLNSPATGDSFPPGKVGRDEGQVPVSAGVSDQHSTFCSLGFGLWRERWNEGGGG